MYGILFRAKAKPGKYQELIEFLEWDGEVCRDKEPGTLRFEFYPDPGDKEALYVYEAYRDENAFEKQHKMNDPYQHWKSVLFTRRKTNRRLSWLFLISSPPSSRADIVTRTASYAMLFSTLKERS